MAWSTEAFWPLAHRLYEDESVVEGRSAGPRFREATGGADRPYQAGGSGFGLDLGQGASGWDWGSKRNGPQSIGKSRGGWNTKIPMVAADARAAIAFALSPDKAHDAPEGVWQLPSMPKGIPMLMDRADEGDQTRQLVLDLGMIPVVPPKSNRVEPWVYDRALYKRRNQIERLFRRLQGFRRIFSRFEKLDGLFPGFRNFALIVEALR
jgi:transposase